MATTLDRADLIAKLTAKFSFEVKAGANHDRYFFRHGGVVVSTSVSRGSKYKTFSSAMVGTLARDLHVSKEELLRMVGCTISAEEYATIVAGG